MLVLAIGVLLVAGGTILFLLRSCAAQRRTATRLTAQLTGQGNALTEARRKLELMFSANPYPMWVYDCETLRFLEVNDAAVRTYGYSREEFLQLTLTDIRPKEDIPAFLDHSSQRYDGYRQAGVWRHCRKDGSLMFMEIMTFESETEGHLTKLGLAHDVTERHRMEEAVQESEASLKALIDNAPFGISHAYTHQNRVITINPALCRILGDYSLEEAMQLDIARQVYADPKDRSRLLEVLRRSGSVEGWETSFRKRDGTLVPVRLTATLSTGVNAESELVSLYVEDMTQQSRLEQQVRQVQKLEAVGRLAGGMAHDFNNVLVVIKLSTELMLGQITPQSPFSKPLLQISQAADRAAALTRQMLAFGRQQMMQPRIINLNNVVSETSQMLRRVIGEDIQLVTNLAENVENSRLDPDQVAQVILNLAVNARDAMPQGGMLHIETTTVELDEAYTKEHPPVQPGRYVMLAVSDTGTGIDKAIQPRIFDPFFTTKEVGKGTGLGLSIVYGIVKQSGGYIWVYSEAGHGTTFKLYFPATTQSPEAPAVRSAMLPRTTGQTLLVVEDDANIRSNVGECLRQFGYRVLEADSCASALELCEQLRGEIDLVLTDLVMPQSSGHELGRAIAELYPEIRVVFMSGYSEDSAARREILERGSLFLQKPFSVADLAKTVQEAMALRVVPLKG